MSLFAGSRRSKFEGAAYTILLLAFFFAVGLAGGVLYRVLPAQKAAESDAASPPAAEAPAAPVADSRATPPVAPVAKTAAAEPSVEAAALPAVAPPAVPPPAPTAALPPPLLVSPTATGSSAETVAPLAKPAAPAEHIAKPAPPSKPTASEASAAAKAVAPAKAAASAKASEHAVRPKPSAVAAAQPPKPPAAKHAPPAAQSAAEAAESGPFRIQFGAFAVEDNAHHIQWSVEATGLPVEIVHAPNRKGHMLYYVRSQPFPDHAAAQSAALAARAKAKSFTQPVALDYVVVSDAAIAAMQGQAPKP